MIHRTHLSDRDFVEHVLDADNLVVVDFWSFWCGPCRQRDSVLDRLAREYVGQVRFARIDIDEQRRVAGSFGVTDAPCVLVFHRGRAIDRLVGSVSRAQLRALIESHLEARQAGSRERIA